jgi:twitching motility protein PilT
VREEAIAGIAQLGVREAIAPLVDIGHTQPETRLAICGALRTLQAREARDSIAHWLDDADADVRRTVIEALEDLGAEAYAHLIEARQEDDSPEVRRAARTVLGRLNIDAGEVVTFANTANLETLLGSFHEADGDDLILLAGSAPFVKRAGRVLPLPGGAVMSARQLQDVDVSYDMKSRGLRFRVNIFQQAGGIGAVFRWIRSDALLLVIENLGLPAVVASFADYTDGLVLIGGPTGSGKSTTLSALVDRINRTSSRHIVTLEDPIETVHKRERSVITQRELGRHTKSFGSALRATLREDPDVIVVGELRDAETIAFAVTAAETGHLVLGTVHAASSPPR